MREYRKKYGPEFIVVGIASVASAAAMVGVSLVLQYVIDLTLGGRVRAAIGVTVAFMAGFAMIYWWAAASRVSLNQKLMEAVRGRIVDRILQKSYLEYGKHHDSDYLSLLTNDVKKIEEGYVGAVFSILTMSAQLILAIAVMTYYSWIYTVIMLLMTAMMLIVPAYFTGKLQKATEEYSGSQEKLTQGASEVVQGFEVIKSFGQEKVHMNKFGVLNHMQRKAGSRLGMLGEANDSVSNVLAFSMQLVICILASWFIFKKHMSYGSMVGVIQVSGSITTPIFGLFSTIPMLRALKPICNKISDYTDIREVRQKESSDVPGEKSEWKHISFYHVDFTYPEMKKKALSEISVDIEKGKKYLITGESGGEKSTFAKLLCGYFKPDAGKIMLDAKAI